MDGGFVRVGPGNKHWGNVEDGLPPPRWDNHWCHLRLPLLCNCEDESIWPHSVNHDRGHSRNLDRPQYRCPTPWSRDQCYARPDRVCKIHTTPTRCVRFM